MDPNSDLVESLLSTPRGRDALQWMADNDITVRIDPDATGGVWSPSEMTMVLGPGYEDPAVVVHEVNHAQSTVNGTTPDARNLSKEDYVSAMLAEEAAGTVLQILAAQEFRAAGQTAASTQLEPVYNDAYDQAIQDGQSEEQARGTAAAAVLAEYEAGNVTTSNNGQSYTDYYGDAWDRAN